MTNIRLLLLGLALAACGGNDKLTDAAPPVDAPPGPPRAVVVGGDFTPGNPGALSTLDLTTKTVQMNAGPAMAVGDDPVLRHFGSDLLIVNRIDGNNVTILDDQSLAFKEQLGTGAGSNPQDVAVLGNKLYVATYGAKGLVMLTRGSTSVTEIDLSADDPDGKPNCASVYRVDNDIYVACQLLDDATFLPRGPGKVYVVDSATNTVKATLTLQTRNPFSLFEQIPPEAPDAGDLLIGTVLFHFGEPDDGIGCVERIKTGDAPAATGCMVDNTELGGYASRVSFQVEGKVVIMWAAIPTTFPKAELRVYDMGSSSFWPGALNPSSQEIGDLAFCPTGDTVVADSTMSASGLRIYNPGGVETTTAVMPVGFRPRSTHGLACY